MPPFVKISLNDIIKLCGKDSIKLINELVINELIQLREEIYNKYKPKTETFFHLKLSFNFYSFFAVHTYL